MSQKHKDFFFLKIYFSTIDGVYFGIIQILSKNLICQHNTALIYKIRNKKNNNPRFIFKENYRKHKMNLEKSDPYFKVL